jgi:DNA-binding CsgD family transcriptional regulator/tetratricopeptide (TPR) repeat protein
MTATDALARGRAAFEREAWSEAYTQLAAADLAATLDPEDLDCLATASYLVGEDAASADARARAHHGFLARGEPIRAARSAFWLAFAIMDSPGQQAQAGGWLARARRLLDENAQDCVEHGFWLCAFAFRKIGSGEAAVAQAGFAEAACIGARFKEPDLVALARHGEGRVLLRSNRIPDGLAMLDEVMVAVTCGEVGPMVAGVVYCSVLSACHELFDLRRATEWTTALTGWCASHPDMVPFRGQCLVRRSELLQLRGDWQEAIDEAERACARLAARIGQPDLGLAFYQLAEGYRLRGEFAKADEAYRRASQAGRKPHPGLALLRLAQGQVDAADAAIRHMLQEARGRPARAHVLRAAVQILLASRDLTSAQSAADELTRMATELDAPFLQAAAAQASGALAQAAGEPGAAVEMLRDAWTIWRELEAPYEIAQVRTILGLAYRQLGDDEGARMEFDAAEDAFDRLGAVPDAARVGALLTSAPRPSGPLTGREVEVLRLIATGKTNRSIAEELAISEKTVARHVSNIFTKLDLSSRSAATAYAYSHKLV